MTKTGVSFGVLSTILKLGFSVLGQSDNYNLSSSHLFKRYQKIMETKEFEYRDEIKINEAFGTICFDHHSMKELSGKFVMKEDRLVILWHCNDQDKLLSVEKIRNKSGLNQARAILRACEEFSIRNHQIIAVTCDNENTNTGTESGACVLLEEDLFKYLLRLMCRHHIYEIMLKDVYRYLFPTETPANIFHSILVEVWNELKTNNFPFNGFEEDDEENMRLFGDSHAMYENFKQRALVELQRHSNHPFIRDDYEEITTVSLKFLTGFRTQLSKSNQVQFHTLQNPSNARFMASAIQGLKCFLFRNHLDWEYRHQIYSHLPRFGLFLTLVYVRYWNRSNNLFDAGINDLSLLKELEEYSIIDRDISQIAIDALSRHLYYLSEELVVLCLFSDKLSVTEKNEIAAKLLQIEEVLPDRNLRSNHIKFNGDVNDWRLKEIIDFVGERSLYLFQSLDIRKEFLRSDASHWATNIQYLNAKGRIRCALVCVNDGAERAISTCKSKYKKQRCKNDNSFRRSMFENYLQ